MQSREYFKFVIAKVENDFNVYEESKELSKALYILKTLKNSGDLLKDIYLISRIKKLKNFGNFLLFIYKKAESGEIKFNNLIENLSTDKEAVESELLNYFDIDKPEITESVIADENKTPAGKEIKEKDITARNKILIERKFKVEELDEELVTEEFIESESKDNLEIVSGRNYLELVPKLEQDEEKSAFVLPDKEEPGEPLMEQEVFNLPGESTEKTFSEKNYEEEIEPIVNTEDEYLKKETEETKEKISVPVEEMEKELSDNSEETIPTVSEEVKEEPIEVAKKEIIEEQENIETEPVQEHLEETTPVSEEIKEPEEEIKEPEEETKVEIEETVTPDETESEREITEEENVSNSVYMKYESELIERNNKIKSGLDELLLLLLEDNREERSHIIVSIIENTSYMEEYSRDMSFEVITGIYNAVKLTFASISDIDGLTIDEDMIILFREAIKLIEGLIKGDEIQGLNKTIKAIDEIKNTLIEKSKERENSERINKEKIQLERHLTEKFTDASQRQKLLIMKEKITDIESIFKSLDNIKGKYQAYDALRILSHTYNRLKEIAKIANSLEMRKLSQLTEASYIFIKFVQNYRLDPLDIDIKEILKYIIYNFKLIYLDKPTKDIDLFISYLNDPVKIFGSKKE